MTRRIAEQLTTVNENDLNGGAIKYGYILRGFPFNTSQALLLDRYLNGVNLAISLKTSSESADYVSSVKPLLDYYSARVSV